MSRRHVPVDRERFRAAMRACVAVGEYPNGARLNRHLGRGGRYLAPVECQWRREDADALGVRLHGRNLDGGKGEPTPRTERKRPRRIPRLEGGTP